MCTDAVVQELTARGILCTRWNTEQYPLDDRLTLRIPHSGASLPTAVLERAGLPSRELNDLTSIWYRRVRTPARPPEVSEGDYAFSIRESRAAISGFLLGGLARPARWMSSPDAVWRAEHKLLQLAVASRLGFEVPETILTNDPHIIRAAFDQFGGAMIAKPVKSGYYEDGTEGRAIFTSQVLREHLESLSNKTEICPTLFQPLIPKAIDLRITVIGDRVLTAAIESQVDPSAKVDWRRTANPLLPHRIFRLPTALEDGIRALVRDLGLTFGALDFILTPDDRYIFLEINPNGQWLWLDDLLDLGITASIADWLTAKS